MWWMSPKVGARAKDDRGDTLGIDMQYGRGGFYGFEALSHETKRDSNGLVGDSPLRRESAMNHCVCATQRTLKDQL